MSLAELVRAWRERALLTQEQLASRSGLGLRTIRRIESPQPWRPRGVSVQLLADALRLSNEECALLQAAARRTPVSMALLHPPVPRQLPAQVTGFIGRKTQLRDLNEHLSSVERPPVISVITGTAGVGKTTLALHWAHKNAHHFPDGQLYTDLRGYNPAGRPADPATAIRGFLDALGINPDRVPQGTDAQAALFRSRLAGRRMLLMLDNARDAEQVRPLLPGDPSCKVLITSRHRLLGLCASHGAEIIALDLLSKAEGAQLLGARLGAKRLYGEPAAVNQIIQGCGGLPLALAIAAANAASRPGDPLADIAKEMSDAPCLLDPFQTADIATDLRGVFSWSRRRLSAGADFLFRLLGLHPGPEVSVNAAARIADLPTDTAVALLAELADAHLISESQPGRYTLHDLLHAYAAEQIRHTESVSRISTARRRLIDYYLHHADAADRLINANRRMDSVQSGSGGNPFSDETDAIAWLTTERTCLSAILGLAASECDTATWRLGIAMAHYLYRHGYWPEHLSTSIIALVAAQQSGDACGEILALINTSRAYIQLCQHDLAEDHLRRAIFLAQSSHDTLGHADSLHILSWVLDLQGKLHQAIAHAERALALFHSANDLTGQARALNTLGWFHSRLGDHLRASDLCRDALRLHQELGHSEGQAATWHSLGYAHHHLGDQQQALTCYNHALRLYQDIRSPYFTANTLASIGDTYQAMDTHEPAVAAWEMARDILEEIEHPEAASVRAKVASAAQVAKPELNRA